MIRQLEAKPHGQPAQEDGLEFLPQHFKIPRRGLVTGVFAVREKSAGVRFVGGGYGQYEFDESGCSDRMA